MSEYKHTWSPYLGLLDDYEKLPSQTLTFIINPIGELIYPLTQLNHVSPTQVDSWVTNPNPHIFAAYLPTNYQQHFQQWLTDKSTEFIICPLKLQKTIWVGIHVDELSSHLFKSIQGEQKSHQVISKF